MRSRRRSTAKLPQSSVRQQEFGANACGVAAVEFAFLFPIVAGMIACVMFGAGGFEISGKLTLTVRTLTDLTTRQTNVGTSSTTYTYSQILNAASLVIAPYDPTQLSLALSEVQTDGAGSGTVIWSQATANGTALAVGSSVAVPSGITTTGYLILGQAKYNYSPFNFFYQSMPITLSDSLYFAPRASTKISCCN